MKKAWLIVLVVIVALWVLLFAFFTGKVPNEQPVMHGLLDLRTKQTGKEDIPLTGEWKFYWNQLVTPNEIPPQSSYTRFPGLWHNITLNGKKLPSVGYATYGLTILLPPDAPAMGLRIPDIYSCKKRKSGNKKGRCTTLLGKADYFAPSKNRYGAPAVAGC